MNRLQRVARVQLTNWAQLLTWPVMILSISFLFNLAFFASMGDNMAAENRATGGIVSIYIMQIIMCSLALSQVFSFAVGLNVTRRTFYLAQSLVVICQSLLYGVLLYVLDVVEQLTNGWGIHMTYFSLGTAVDGYSPLSIVIYTVPMVLCSYVGLFYGVNEWFGVSPRTFVFIDTTISAPLGQLSMVPMLALIARTAPRGAEATMFAIMASLMNLALSASELGTRYLNEAFGVSQQDYSGLGRLLIAVGLIGLLPLLALPLLRREEATSLAGAPPAGASAGAS